MPAPPRPAPRKSARKAAASSPKRSPNGLGARLRAARERAGVGLREFARRVSVSPSLVSQIERGSVKPSVGTLYAMANELGLMLDELFKDREPAPGGQPRTPAGAPGPMQRHGLRKTIRLASGVRWERLTAAQDKEVEFLRVTYDVGGASCGKDALMRHGGKEYAFMISGRLGVRIGFEEFELGPGDSISFDAQSPHRLWTVGKKPAVAIWVVVNRHNDRRRRRAA